MQAEGISNQLKEKIFKQAQSFGQGHLVQHYNSLTDQTKKADFLAQLASINFSKTASLYNNVYLQSKKPKEKVELNYAPITNVADRKILAESQDEFSKIGRQSISKGQVGVCIMSGGQGTRLGFDHPKGMFDIGLDLHFTLFQFFSRRLQRLMSIVKKEYPDSKFTDKNMIKWYIMTSDMNNKQVNDFFKNNNYFGYDPESIIFFPQGGIPAVDYDGKIMIEDVGQISLAPGGNGAIYEQMKEKQVIKHMNDNGVKYIYLGPVDNILLKVADPVCLGYMIKNSYDIVSTYVDKISAEEKVGLHLSLNGKVSMIEYSEATPEVRQTKSQQGQFVYKHGNRATMFISTSFIESLTSNQEVVEKLNKKYHLAEKKIKYLDKQTGKAVKPQKTNGVKFQLFYFDVFQETDKFGLFETTRSDEFAPVKNATGDDSPQSARNLLRNLHMKWIKNAGVQVQGEGYVQIDPILCYDGEGVAELVQSKFGANKIKLPAVIQ